jgi:Dolichyl-phosphate-mannose-protein mannosyltransferase
MGKAPDSQNPGNRPDSPWGRYSGIALGTVLASGFLWRLELGQATFFNTDEAWHFALANQSSASLAYQASLTVSHPPLLILILYFWRGLGTSNLILRLPSVIAGVAFAWIFYRWLDLMVGRAAAVAGLILAAFLPPMISTSAEVRQNPLLLVFLSGAIYCFDRALQDRSPLSMCASSVCLYLAMLSHYAAFLAAAVLGLYSILRFAFEKPSRSLRASWLGGQIGGVALAGFLYKTHLGRLNQTLSPSLLPGQYLAGSYFHPGSDHLFPFLFRGTLGVFRFVFGQTQMGPFAAIFFLMGVALLFLGKGTAAKPSRTLALGILLLLPFVLNSILAARRLYPYGRTRQCMFLAIFCLAGVSLWLSAISRRRPLPAAGLAIAIVLFCHLFGTLQDRDAFPLAEQRHQHMDAAIQWIRGQVRSEDVILTDRATSFQVRHYLCEQKPVSAEMEPGGLERFHCQGFQVVSTGVAAGALTAESVVRMCAERPDLLATAQRIWVVEGGWASGLGERLRSQDPALRSLEIHSFGRYLEIFEMPPSTRANVAIESAPQTAVTLE